jgi:hypothetical protein
MMFPQLALKKEIDVGPVIGGDPYAQTPQSLGFLPAGLRGVR